RRMREYLRALKDSDVLETSILPLGDGVTISVYKSGYRANMENSVSG
ncbi:MAG: O-methyltransferase, partial [Bilifractor porci]